MRFLQKTSKDGCRTVGASEDETSNDSDGRGAQPEKKELVLPRANSGVGAFRPHVTLGPPGCGKTRRLLELFTDELERGVRPERIALVTFTRAARREALDRAQKKFALAGRRFAWVRTIHSAAFALMELSPGRILDDERLAEFAQRHGYDLTIGGHHLDDDAVEPLLVRGRSRDDALLFAYEWGRNCLLDLEQTLSRCPVEDLPVPQLRLFVRRLIEFKDEHQLLDFSDLLETVLEKQLRPDVDVAMIDEAHDLSPLQIAVVEMWFASCARSYVCADDDQAIYGWNGASPDWIHELARRREPEVLEHSHRVPVIPHALAQRIISGNVHRLRKNYEPAPKYGRIVQADLDQALDMVASSSDAFVLVRNRMFVARATTGLLERAVPFVVEGWGGWSPLGDERSVKAVRLALRLERGDPGPFPTSDVAALLHFVPATSALIAPDADARVRERKSQGSFMRVTLIEDLGFAPLVAAIEDEGPLSVLSKMPRSSRRYFERLVQRYGNVPDPTAVVTTVHAAKGRERELVVVLPDMTRTTYSSYLRSRAEEGESERRVFYVAVTRTKDTLVLVQPRSRRHFEFPAISSHLCGGSARREQFEERAAIQEFEGGLARSEAERRARMAVEALMAQEADRG
jgi:superfamily I DNA/RNA helicase